jgi:hypothetical protein
MTRFASPRASSGKGGSCCPMRIMRRVRSMASPAAPSSCAMAVSSSVGRVGDNACSRSSEQTAGPCTYVVDGDAVHAWAVVGAWQHPPFAHLPHALANAKLQEAKNKSPLTSTVVACGTRLPMAEAAGRPRQLRRGREAALLLAWARPRPFRVELGSCCSLALLR